MVFLLRTQGGKCVYQRNGRSAERKFVPVVLISIDTSIWSTSKTLDVDISVSGLGGCVPAKWSIWIALKKSKRMDFKARNFITLIYHDDSRNVSQTISCIVAISKIIAFGWNNPSFRKIVLIWQLGFQVLDSGKNATFLGKLFFKFCVYKCTRVCFFVWINYGLVSYDGFCFSF